MGGGVLYECSCILYWQCCDVLFVCHGNVGTALYVGGIVISLPIVICSLLVLCCSQCCDCCNACTAF